MFAALKTDTGDFYRTAMIYLTPENKKVLFKGLIRSLDEYLVQQLEQP